MKLVLCLSPTLVIRSPGVSHHETRVIVIILRPVLPEIVHNNNF